MTDQERSEPWSRRAAAVVVVLAMLLNNNFKLPFNGSGERMSGSMTLCLHHIAETSRLFISAL
jgi:hypothetical protein